MEAPDIPTGIRLGIVRGISYGLFGKPDPFVPQVRGLGGGLVRVYFYWGQVEPEPSRFTWDAVDAFLEQLDGSEEVWVTLCSSSRWATRQPTDFLPPSPARDPESYQRFVEAVVQHCRGHVDYWQCDNEPCNVGLTWAGTAADYVAQLKVMYRAVKAVDAGSAVILGGAPYGLPSSPEESPERAFFDEVLRDGRDVFDLFDLHLYADHRRIPADLEAARRMMRAHGYEKPIVVGEYNGPSPDLFPEASAALQETMAAAFGAAAATAEDIDATAVGQTPERVAMSSLYERMGSLPPQLQMFMAGCPPELEQRRDRINCREIVTRNLEALAAGVRRTACWCLAPEVPNYEDHLSAMDLFYGKFPLMAYEGRELRRRHASAETFALLSDKLRGVEQVILRESPPGSRARIFEVQRSTGEPLFVAWERRDAYRGEDEPEVGFEWPWPWNVATAVDAFGVRHPVAVRQGRAAFSLSATPLFLSAG
ncbi:MAG: hypothetical protein J2P38_01445 [Candidatus Dormibacteraeota bacterium]|nr:hypothetical protein [Candidatus Dormibacteraeota bacterium]